MKTSELEKLLSEGGCYFLKRGGEHDTWFCPKTGKKVRIHRHKSKEVPKGTAERILRDAGVK